MTNVQGTAIIRSRGQLTIPEKVRDVIDWAKPNSVVSMTITSDKRILLEPYETFKNKATNWDEVWAGIQWARSLKSKRGSASDFIIRDREKH